jgi:hypothetical protein
MARRMLSRWVASSCLVFPFQLNLIPGGLRGLVEQVAKPNVDRFALLPCLGHDYPLLGAVEGYQSTGKGACAEFNGRLHGQVSD